MNFQQLRIIRETVRCQFNLTEVGNALFTSQSGVSKHIKDLEDELGVELFVRKGKRLLGLTPPGKELVVIVERMLIDAQNIKNLADQYTSRDEGELTVATTHTQSRYALPSVVKAFKENLPKVHLRLHQGSPEEIATMHLNGRADMGIATEALPNIPDLVSFPYYTWYHAAVVTPDHPLAQQANLTLEAISQYPIITYHDGYTGRPSIDKTFAQAGLKPDIIMSAMDSDVIKTYAEIGLGVGIIASMGFHPTKDSGLQLLHSEHLFEPNTTVIAVRQGHFLRGFAYRFIELCNPHLDEITVREAINPTR